MAKPSNRQREQTQPAEERGERIATGRAIARGAKDTGHVPGATEHPPTAGQPQVVTPPAPPGESSPEAVQKTQAVADALAQLGENADPKRVAEALRIQAGIDLNPGEVTQMMAALRERAQPPPEPDQPPPEDARRTYRRLKSPSTACG